LSKWFQTRRFLWEFPIGSYVKLCSAHHYAYTVQIWAHSGLKKSNFGHLKKKNIFSNSGHHGYRTALTDTILKGTHLGTIPARFGLIFFSGFREDLNVILYQNMPNLHNRYISAERKISQKNSEYMLNYSLPCSCS
jgi:hypothetical protein